MARSSSPKIIGAMGTHGSFIFRVISYNPYIGGLKPSCFMVLGSKGKHYYDNHLKPPKINANSWELTNTSVSEGWIKNKNTKTSVFSLGNITVSHTIWYIYLHLVDFHGKCREIYMKYTVHIHTWSYGHTVDRNSTSDLSFHVTSNISEFSKLHIFLLQTAAPPAGPRISFNGRPS